MTAERMSDELLAEIRYQVEGGMGGDGEAQLLLLEVDRLRAALDRVTDDGFEDEMERALEAANRWDSGYADVAAALTDILATIRAVAAGEQNEGDDRG